MSDFENTVFLVPISSRFQYADESFYEFVHLHILVFLCHRSPSDPRLRVDDEGILGAADDCMVPGDGRVTWGGARSREIEEKDRAGGNVEM